MRLINDSFHVKATSLTETPKVTRITLVFAGLFSKIDSKALSRCLSADVVRLAYEKELVSFESLFPCQWCGFEDNAASDGNAADTFLEKEYSRSTRFAGVKLRARPMLYNPRTVNLGRGSGHERSLHFI